MKLYKNEEKRPTCKNERDYTFTSFSKLKSIIAIKYGDFYYCFSCNDIKSFKKNDFFYSDERKLKIFKRWFPYLPEITIEQINELIKLTNDCDEEEVDEEEVDEEEVDEEEVDEEEVDDEIKIITYQDTIPYIKELGVYELLENREIKRIEIDDFGTEREVNKKAEIIEHIKNLSSEFANKNDLKDFPVYEDISSNIHVNNINYYEKINDYLEKNDLKYKYIEHANNINLGLTPAAPDINRYINRYINRNNDNRNDRNHRNHTRFYRINDDIFEDFEDFEDFDDS